jgi:hypothetical protein
LNRNLGEGMLRPNRSSSTTTGASCSLKGLKKIVRIRNTRCQPKPFAHNLIHGLVKE